jgi:RNA polymerase sigma-70 factor (ECF subfamily)
MLMRLPITCSAPRRDAKIIGDDRLRLVSTCCHPALSRDAQIALTLRKKISTARIPYRVPSPDQLAERVSWAGASRARPGQVS